MSRIPDYSVDEYMPQVLYKAINDWQAKSYDYASANVQISLSFSHEELMYLYNLTGGVKNE